MEDQERKETYYVPSFKQTVEAGEYASERDIEINTLKNMAGKNNNAFMMGMRSLNEQIEPYLFEEYINRKKVERFGEEHTAWETTKGFGEGVIKSPLRWAGYAATNTLPLIAKTATTAYATSGAVGGPESADKYIREANKGIEAWSKEIERLTGIDNAETAEKVVGGAMGSVWGSVAIGSTLGKGVVAPMFGVSAFQDTYTRQREAVIEGQQQVGMGEAAVRGIVHGTGEAALEALQFNRIFGNLAKKSRPIAIIKDLLENSVQEGLQQVNELGANWNIDNRALTEKLEEVGLSMAGGAIASLGGSVGGNILNRKTVDEVSDLMKKTGHSEQEIKAVKDSLNKIVDSDELERAAKMVANDELTTIALTYKEQAQATADELVTQLDSAISRNELVETPTELPADVPPLYQLGEMQIDTQKNPSLGMVLYQAEQEGKPFETLGQVMDYVGGKLDVEQAQKMNTGINAVYKKTYDELKSIGQDDALADANARLRSTMAFAIANTYGGTVEGADRLFGNVVSQRASEFEGQPQLTQYQDVAQRINEIDMEEQANGVPEYTAPTININGVERQTTNSNGDPIAKSGKSLRYFYNWFGDSKVVDEQGRPLVVYHGSTESNIDIFDIGRGTHGLAYGVGAYFTRNKALAENIYGKNVYSVYLRERNPFSDNTENIKEMKRLFDAVNEEYRDGDTISKITNKNEEQTYKSSEITETLKSMGYDGVIFGYNMNPSRGIEYVAFEPNQIKSVDNRGAYSKTSPNIYYEFGGMKAKTAALDKLEQAKRMENEKANTEDIRKQTGWFKGKDGKWRFEISDKDARFKDIKSLKFNKYKDENGNDIYEIKLSDLLEHEKLFAAYPELEDVDVIITEEKQKGDEVLGGEVVDGKIKLYSDALGYRTQGKKTLLHEIQHLIQNIEGFARGGSSSDFVNAILGLQGRIDAYKKDLINNVMQNKFGKTFSGFDASMLYDDAFADKLIGNWFYENYRLNRSEVLQELRKHKDEITSKYEKFKNETKENFKYKTAIDYYKSIYGEVEARNTVARMVLDESERLGKSIESTQDVSTEDAIVIFDDGSQAEYISPKLAQEMKGAYYNNTVYLFENADQSTFVHEMAHAYMDALTRLAESGNAQAQNDLNVIRKWLGKKQGEAFTQADWERFARGFEMYLREGKAPNQYLGGKGGVFERFKNWLMNIYAGIKSLTVTNEKGKQEPVKINKQIKEFYDEMLGGEDIDSVLKTAQENEQAMATIQRKMQELADLQQRLAEERANLVREMANNVRPETTWSNIKDWGNNLWESARELPSNVLQSSYSRLAKIDPRLGLLVQRAEQSQGLRVKRWTDQIKPFYEAFNKLSAQDKAKVQFYLLNQQWGGVKELLGEDATESVQDMLKEIYEELVASGVDVGHRDNYFPRSVLDYDGLLQEMGLTYPALRKEMEEAIGKNATPEEQAEWLDKHIMGFRGTVSTQGNRNTKERKLDLITDKMAKYYKPSMETLVDYVEGMSKLLSMREAFGKDIEHKEGQDSIGKIIENMLGDKRLSKKQIDEVRNVLSALYLPNGMGNKFLQAMRQYGYATKLSYSTTVRQFADIGMMMKVNGVLNTLDALFHPDKRITLENLGIDPLGEEFKTSKKDVGGKIANFTTKWRGINWADAIMKNAYMRSNYKSLQDLAKTPEKFHEKYDAMFGDETDTLIRDLNNDKLSEPVKVLLFHEISKIQPISRSAMPTAYLSNPNGRVFYMFKTFSLHRAEYMVSELADDFRRGDFLKAGKDIMADVAVIGWEGLVELLIAFLKYGWQAFAAKEVIDTFAGAGLGVLGLNKHQALQLSRGQVGDFFQEMIGVGTPLDDIGYMIRHYDDEDKLLRALLPDMIIEPLIAGPKRLGKK